MRRIKVTLSGQEWGMPVTFKVSKAIAEAVGDPLKLAIASHNQGAVLFSTDDVVAIIHIGVKEAGCSFTKDQVGEAIIQSDGGVIAFVKAAGEYIGALVSGGPEKPLPTGDAKKNITPTGTESSETTTK